MVSGIRNILAAKINAYYGNPGDEPVVDNKIRQAWNDYVDWAAAKGYKGNPELDKNGLGFKLLEQYKAENPNSPLTKELVSPIQQEFQKYRDWSLKEVAAGRAQLTPGVTPDNYMKGLSVVDGYPGSLTTSFKFPASYLKTFENGKLVSNQNTGFATTNK